MAAPWSWLLDLLWEREMRADERGKGRRRRRRSRGGAAWHVLTGGWLERRHGVALRHGARGDGGRGSQRPAGGEGGPRRWRSLVDREEAERVEGIGLEEPLLAA